MRNIYFYLIFTLALFLPSDGCYAYPIAESNAAQSNNKFALKLYKELSKNSGNLFFSPLSISAAMQMTLPGAQGETRNQIMSALALKDGDTFLQDALSLTDQLQSISVTFSIANSLWGEASYGIQDSYIDTAKKFFKSEVRRVDFKNKPEKQRLLINDWVSDKTNQKITNLLAPNTVASDTRLILANAVYFLGKWNSEFDPEDTRPGSFFVSVDEKIPAHFMSQTKQFQYFENDSMQLLQLPYYGQEFVMEIFLPKSDIAITERDLIDNQASVWLNQMTNKNVTVQMPRFKSESSFSLVDALSKLGIKDSFEFGLADFSGISNNKELYISDVVHKSFVEVGEKGTEAAAATAIIMRVGSAMKPESERPILFRADRPFIYQLRHLPTGAIIFMGRMQRP